MNANVLKLIAVFGLMLIWFTLDYFKISDPALVTAIIAILSGLGSSHLALTDPRKADDLPQQSTTVPELTPTKDATS